ncbi:MAG: hypothetical protein HY782_06020 [Chloroflexi bacterium]|nr:hypothetical protein [Chloroflexota bacterium]
MQFKIGEQVVHPVFGVGTVKTYTEQQFAGDQARYYYEVATSGPTVWVPINAQGSTVLRRISSKATLDECRSVLTSKPLTLDKNRQMRQLELATRLKDGSLTARCEIVRDLTAESRRKPLGANDGLLLKKVTKVLSEEWAAAEGVTTTRAVHEIEDLLQAGRRDVEKNGARTAGWSA